jgi:putative peptidoglycan binding protein
VSDDLILLIVGFVLTTVLGGALGSFFQRRAWQEQHRVQKRDEANAQALRTFEEISRLFDKRIHRMRLLNGALLNRRRRRDNEAAEALDDAHKEYREVLVEWNDNLNRVLALTEVSFGSETRASAEALYEQYASLGRALDLALRLDLRNDPDPVTATSLAFARRLKRLSDGVYQINVRMLSILRDDEARIAAFSAGGLDAAAASDGHPDLAIGDQGAAVRTLQIALREWGHTVDVDGSFGVGTYRALRNLQADQGLTADALVGPQTWEKLSAPPP